MAGAMAMLVSLVLCQFRVACDSLVGTLRMAGRILVRGSGDGGTVSWERGSKHALYEGVVYHERRHPVRHKFEYKVRYALVNLDEPPAWYANAAAYHMTAEKARSFAGTAGPVYLLCMPTSCAYEQNPLSVYYCYDDAAGTRGSSVPRTVAEVTNTPWAERVTFAFDSNGDTVPKSLHVSPFMDMDAAWKMHAPPPGEKLFLRIRSDHAEYGEFFTATLRARRVDSSLNVERFLWMVPQTVAIWIYWQALVLWWKGVKVQPHPKDIDGDLYQRRAAERDAEIKLDRPVNAAHRDKGSVGGAGQSTCPRVFEWREADGYPWL